jgi:hypothetical protein
VRFEPIRPPILTRFACCQTSPEEVGVSPLAAASLPAVFINIAHGHNGFLTAALFGGGLLLLERREMLAGILFGLLCYKPQFGVLIPLALAAGGVCGARFERIKATRAMSPFTAAAANVAVWTSWTRRR